MPDIVKRGYVKSDEIEFGETNIKLLKTAQMDIAYLINRGYEMNRAVTFVGNRYLFSKRQRMALTRATVKEEDRIIRNKKRIPIYQNYIHSYKESIENRGKRNQTVTPSPKVECETVYIDGFNTIITLEAALSYSTLLLCMDDVLRDLCGLHGTYRIIDKTDMAIDLITKKLMDEGVGKAIYYLDRPVSNSGRLKRLILQSSQACRFDAEVYLVDNPDPLLWDKEFVISSDAIVLNRCYSWINLVQSIVGEYLPELKPVDLSQNV